MKNVRKTVLMGLVVALVLGGCVSVEKRQMGVDRLAMRVQETESIEIVAIIDEVNSGLPVSEGFATQFGMEMESAIRAAWPDKSVGFAGVRSGNTLTIQENRSPNGDLTFYVIVAFKVSGTSPYCRADVEVIDNRLKMRLTPGGGTSSFGSPWITASSTGDDARSGCLEDFAGQFPRFIEEITSGVAKTSMELAGY